MLIPYGNLMRDERGDAAAAEDLYLRAIAAGDSFGHCNLAGLYTDLDRLAEAEEQYCLGVAAGDHLAARNFGLFLVEEGRPDDRLPIRRIGGPSA